MSQRWQRKRERANHADDWLMTYADMITLLLCFFAIFLSISIPKVEIPKKTESVHVEHAPPPEITEGNLPFHGAPESKQPDVVEGNLPFHDPMTNDQSAENPPVVAQAQPNETPPASPPVAAAVTDPQPPLSLPAIVDHMKADGATNEKGDRITTLEMNSAAFFASGSAVLSDPGKAILKAVAANLKSDDFRDYQITVEGHTDDAPISTAQFPSNWELSTARASAVVQYFLSQEIPARKLRAAGYADTFPKAPNRDATGNAIPANQAQNRRVVIKLEKIEKAE